jgi:hypothetical protein
MTPDQRERLTQLCEQIAKEQNHARFHRLVKELNDLLEKKEQRLDESGHDVVTQRVERKSA